MTDWTRRRFLGTGAALLAGATMPLPAAAAASDEDPFARLDATDQAALVRSGEVTPAELVEAAIARARVLDPALHSIVTPMFEQAAARLTRGIADGPFRGVPTLVKDLTPVAGVPLYRGSRMFLNEIASESHELVRAMEASGMVVIGKSATPEFGLLPSTSPRAFPPTRNPWDTNRDPGGSSGGSAAAVAAGIVPIAQGSDGGGSIRIPASSCGLFGMKPSRGRLPTEPTLRPVDLSVRGFLTRSVRDAQTALAYFEQTGPALPSVADPELAAKRKLRIAFTTETPDGAELHPDCRKAVESAADLCRQLGHTVGNVRPAHHRPAMRDAMITLWASGPAGLLQQIEAQSGALPPSEALEPWTWGLANYFRALPADALEKAIEETNRGTEEAKRLHQDWDVLLTATAGAPPLLSGHPDQSQPFEAILTEVFAFVPYTYLANMTGRPAMSVPLHWNDAGLPIGCQFAGRTGEEALLFQLARELEAARPWADRWPPPPVPVLA